MMMARETYDLWVFENALNEIDQLRELAVQLTGGDTDPCNLDHHGYCQDHHGGFADGGCATRRLNELRERLGW